MIETTSAKHLEFMIRYFYDGLILLEASESLSSDGLETLYALGYNLFTCGKYEASKNIFNKLAACAPYTAYLWRAVGAVNQQMKNYPEAIAAYDRAIAYDKTDIVSLVYRAESQILSGNIIAGVKNLETVVNHQDMYPNSEPWLKRAKLLLRLHKQP